jgi:hypothetical protein
MRLALGLSFVRSFSDSVDLSTATFRKEMRWFDKNG